MYKSLFTLISGNTFYCCSSQVSYVDRLVVILFWGLLSILHMSICIPSLILVIYSSLFYDFSAHGMLLLTLVRFSHLNLTCQRKLWGLILIANLMEFRRKASKHDCKGMYNLSYLWGFFVCLIDFDFFFARSPSTVQLAQLCLAHTPNVVLLCQTSKSLAPWADSKHLAYESRVYNEESAVSFHTSSPFTLAHFEAPILLFC